MKKGKDKSNDLLEIDEIFVGGFNILTINTANLIASDITVFWITIFLVILDISIASLIIFLSTTF